MTDPEIAKVVREHGWSATDVFDASPRFLYSAGLMQSFDHPEFVIFGLDSGAVHFILSALVHDIRDGVSFAEPGAYPGILAGDHRIGIRRVDPTQHALYLGDAMGYCRHTGRIGELRAVQVFWPDEKGKFPFEVGCDMEVFQSQPRLDIPLTHSEIEDFDRRWGGG